MNLFESFWQILFPEHCLGCKKAGSPLCARCLSALPPPREELPDIISFFEYRNETVKQALWQLKYRNKKGLARALAESLADRLSAELAELAVFKNFKDPLLVPTPLTPRRFRKRSYNQAALLADELSQLTGLPALSALCKIKETPTQVSVRDRTARLSNLIGAFGVISPEKIKERNIFVVDDIATTGATIAEARRALLAAGAKKVLGLTVAH
ncbi:MAG TPA: hypothetical protein VJ103_01845 [Candidatus Paceibacterota bacterium]|nr:hypothetical protein [Candidatus Paceibacterota bacterium]